MMRPRSAHTGTAVAAFDAHPNQLAAAATAATRTTTIVTVWDPNRQGFRAVEVETTR